MDSGKMTLDVIALVAGSMSVIGFLSVWIKMGVEKGEQKKAMELLEQKTGKHEKEIADLKNKTHSIQLDIARSMGRIEVKIDHLKETVDAIKGGRRAAEK